VPKPTFVACVMLGALLNVVAAQKTNADASQCSKEILHNFGWVEDWRRAP